jgi:hypothetical protein
MFDKFIYEGLHIIMRYAGRLNSWAWRKHVKILRREQNIQHEKLLRDQENREYLEELKRKL